MTIGFTALTTASVVQEALTGAHDGGGKRLVGAMVLFIVLAILLPIFDMNQMVK